MAAELTIPRWAYRENVVVTLVKHADGGETNEFLIVRDSLAPGAFVLGLFAGMGPTVNVNGVPILLAEHELIAICDLVDEPYMGCPDMENEVGRPHPVQR